MGMLLWIKLLPAASIPALVVLPKERLFFLEMVRDVLVLGFSDYFGVRVVGLIPVIENLTVLRV